MKQANPDRIRELLRIMDWLAAPFGTQEDMLLTFGLPDADYTLDAEGQPKPTPAGTTNAAYVPWRYMSQFPYVEYQADLPNYAATMFEAETIQVNAGVLDPTLGYYSPTNFSRGRLAETNFRQAAVDMVVGRRPLKRLQPGRCRLAHQRRRSESKGVPGSLRRQRLTSIAGAHH